MTPTMIPQATRAVQPGIRKALTPPATDRQQAQCGWGGTTPDPRPTMNVPMPRPKPAPKPKAAYPVYHGIRAMQYALLDAAIAEGGEALEAFAVAEQDKRDGFALKQWPGYRLLIPAGHEFAVGIYNPKGDYYALDLTTDGVKRFLGCPDQEFVDAVNAALRGAGRKFRLETKHAAIWWLREEAERRGEITRTEVAPSNPEPAAACSECGGIARAGRLLCAGCIRDAEAALVDDDAGDTRRKGDF